MTDISRQRCFNHADREASAKCLSCGRFFCRECATEHDSRVICSACLSELNKPKTRRKLFSLPAMIRIKAGIWGIIILWFFFFKFGQILLSVPDAYHRKRTWREKFDQLLDSVREDM